jgi:hypothetical protein
LQFNINRLDDWSKKWQLIISSSKSAMLNVGRNELNQAYEIDEVRVKSVSEIRDLGVKIYNELNMASHINYTLPLNPQREHI